MTANENQLTLTDRNFESHVLESATPVLVDFWAEWCAPCRRVAPIVKELARKFEGRATVAKLDVDTHPELAQRFGVRSIPTLLFFRDGSVVDNVVGAATADVLAEKLEKLIASG